MAIVTDQAEFRNAITAAEPEIILANNITLTTYVSIAYPVTIKGETPDLSLFWGNPTAGNRNMLVVTSAGTLTLESIILDAENRDGTLVQVNGGTLILNEGTIIRNILSTTSQSGITIGTTTTTMGGTCVMNSGLVTGINASSAIFCRGGIFTMLNDAAVKDNMAAGVSIIDSNNGLQRGTFTMAGNACVSGNRAKQPAGGIILLASDMYMGIDENDAPVVSDNRPPSGFYGGGIVMTSDSTLTMRCASKICENYTDYAGGGLLVNQSTVVMRDNASISDNICDGVVGGGGIRLHQNARLTMEGNACITGNTSAGYGGGLYMQPGSYFEMKDKAAVFDNVARNGAGIYIASTETAASTATIGADDAHPKIYHNTASEIGGGMIIRPYSRLDLTGYACVSDNHAGSGNGIYKEGMLCLSQSAQVLDGLFFDDLSTSGVSAYLTENQSHFQIIAESSETGVHMAAVKTAPPHADTIKPAVSVLQTPAYTDNVPVITENLSPLAQIVLEFSEYISPPNVSLVIADKSDTCAPLAEHDRAAWVLPPDFGPEHAVILNTECNQVHLVYQTFYITYCHLYGTENPNPETYSAASAFPIVLQNPSHRKGYAFAGWYNCAGQRVTKISAGTLEDLLLIATWNKYPIYCIQYGNLCGVYNPNPKYYSMESAFPILLQQPGKRKGFIFKGWYDRGGQLVTEIPEGTTGDLWFIAHWQEKQIIYLCFDGNAPCAANITNLPVPIFTQPYDMVVIPFGEPKRPHYCFVAWNTSPCGNGQSYAPNEEIMIEDMNITLYAIWKPVCYNENSDRTKYTALKCRDYQKKWR